jgi:hypothetical protein
MVRRFQTTSTLNQPHYASSRPNMPVCSRNECTRGYETRCAQHRSTRRTYNYNSDSTDFSSPHPHMSVRARRLHAHTAGNHDMHRRNGYGSALIRYTDQDHGYNHDAQLNDLAESVVQVLETSSDSHAIAVAEYSLNPSTGTYSFLAQANLDREQCTVCHQWYPNRYQLEHHHQEFPIGCEKCGVCLRRDSVTWHADTKKHGRCFIRDCGSGFRMFGNWKSRFVKRHILEAHYRGY